MPRKPSRDELQKVNQLIGEIHNRKRQLSQLPPDNELSGSQLRMKQNLELTIQMSISYLLSTVHDFDVIPSGVFTVFH
uniref:AsIV-cont00023-ORF1 n=1 Tax=Apophua simplicipes ichnovirus TaxID=1329648 RepID=S5DYS7_9VIRU|nr:AsIV-cont00023-ORF1 [Apophua simplicipes ichnovirus]